MPCPFEETDEAGFQAPRQPAQSTGESILSGGPGANIRRPPEDHVSSGRTIIEQDPLLGAAEQVCSPRWGSTGFAYIGRPARGRSLDR